MLRISLLTIFVLVLSMNELQTLV